MNNNSTINKFINWLKETLKEENYERKEKLDIPYLIAPLIQCLSLKKYKDFIDSITQYEYDITYLEDLTEGYTNGSVKVNLYNKNNYEPISYNFEIIFTHDERNWGYCLCTKEDKDYREDKHCCGHGCDWYAPAFILNKILHIGTESFSGDEHEYWDYEDEICKQDQELSNEKARKEKENRITYLTENIRAMQLELLSMN